MGTASASSWSIYFSTSILTYFLVLYKSTWYLSHNLIISCEGLFLIKWSPRWFSFLVLVSLTLFSKVTVALYTVGSTSHNPFYVLFLSSLSHLLSPYLNPFYDSIPLRPILLWFLEVDFDPWAKLKGVFWRTLELELWTPIRSYPY